MSDAPRQCQAITASGERCRQASSVNGSGFCLWHDPARVEEAEAVRAAGRERAQESRTASAMAPAGGGTAPASPPPAPTSLEEVVQYQAWVVGEVAAGRLAPKVGSTLTYALTNMKSVLKERDLERELAELRAEVKQLRQRRGLREAS